MTRFIFPMLMCTPAVAGAGELALDIHGFSKHFDSDIEYNESNSGLGLAYGHPHAKAIGGFFNNSFDDKTYYAGIELMTASPVRFGLGVGLTYGYRERVTRTAGYVDFPKGYEEGFEMRRVPIKTDHYLPTYAPMAALFIEYSSPVSARVTYIPETGRSPAVAVVSARILLMR